MPSIHHHIADKIDQQAEGTLLFPADFRGLGSEDAIKMSLCRHAKDGRLERLGHGIYLKNKPDAKSTPLSPEAIAVAIGKRECIRIKPSGAFALYQLGLITKPPDDLVYITDGEPRNIRLGDKRLVFKSTTPKKLSLSAGISGLLVQALEELGKDKITDQLKEQLTKQMQQVKEDVLMEDLRLAPAWIYDLLYKLNQHITR